MRVALGGFRDDGGTEDERNTRERRKGRNVLNYRRLLEALAADLEGPRVTPRRELVCAADSEFQLELAKTSCSRRFSSRQRGEGALLALLFDDYSAVADEELALWIVELIERIGSRRPVLAVATTVGLTDVPKWLPPQIEIRNLEPFTRTEIADPRACVPRVALAPDWPLLSSGGAVAIQPPCPSRSSWPGDGHDGRTLEGDDPVRARRIVEAVARPGAGVAESDAERAALEVGRSHGGLTASC
jgi:hypothetical protein